ncbi:MAG: hydrogenase maturation protease [Acidobacteria bacterium]|nr:hydrogenase maturation protease [Acidobacteriota bacterium]
MEDEAGRYRVLVIGYGNPMRGDDGLGWRAATQLAGLALGPGVKVLACTELAPELAEDVSRADRVIFIDAAADTPPGKLRVLPLTPLRAAEAPITHHLTPRSLLSLAGSLYGRCPEAAVVSLGAACFDLGERLSAEAEAVFPLLIDSVRELVEASETAWPGEINRTR